MDAERSLNYFNISKTAYIKTSCNPHAASTDITKDNTTLFLYQETNAAISRTRRDIK